MLAHAQVKMAETRRSARIVAIAATWNELINNSEVRGGGDATRK